MITRLKEILKEKNMTISVAESCTGGNLQSILTSINGSSEYFDGGICCYTIDQKVKHLGVDRKIAEPVDCVSQEVADQMALGCSKLFETNITISTTGYIKEKLYYSICINNEIVFSEEMELFNSRVESQKYASIKLIEILVRILDTQYSPNSII